VKTAGEVKGEVPESSAKMGLAQNE
jgi:hypothetical protein